MAALTEYSGHCYTYRIEEYHSWAFSVVVIVGMILSVWIANISMKKHKAVEKS